MKLSKIQIRNFRLLIDTELEVDSTTTLIVGRNNTGKTSLFDCLRFVLKEKLDDSFTFNDYPLVKRDNLFLEFDSFVSNQISFDELCKKVEPISIELTIDYSLDDSNDNLGTLSPFIIDIDEDTTTALIRVEYKLIQDETKLRKLLNDCYMNDKKNTCGDAHNAIKLIFNKLFELKIYAVNPNNVDEKQFKQLSELKALFPFFYIPAERILGENEEKDDSLSSLITYFFDSNEEEIENGFAEKMNQLRTAVNEANKNVQEKSESILSELVKQTVGFGYPNSEELSLGVTTQLSIDNQIKNQTQLSYKTGADKDSLPECYNGLGYKNLIKIEFLLATFVKDLKKYGSACIPLLFIEEPESHMHPQMQHSFAKYLETFLERLSSNHIQIF